MNQSKENQFQNQLTPNSNNFTFIISFQKKRPISCDPTKMSETTTEPFTFKSHFLIVETSSHICGQILIF
jgi:hypothetical protein